MPDTPVTQYDDVYTIYPAHLKRLMEEHNLSVPEICAALGMPSLQEWYAIQKKPNQPVRHPRIVQTARIFLRHPERLPISQPSVRQFTQRCMAIVGDEVKAIRLIEALLHKQWRTIKKWMKTPGADNKLDISIRRLIVLMMDMDDEEFLVTLSDGSTSFFVQVNACPVHTFKEEASGKRLYSTSHQPELKRDVLEILDAAPAPGRRLQEDEYVVLSKQGPSFSEIKGQMAEPRKQSATDKAIDEALGVDKDSLSDWRKQRDHVYG